MVASFGVDGSAQHSRLLSSRKTTEMNHGDLCNLGVKWLRRPASQDGPGCNIAASECTGSYSGEITDAIGFRSVGDEQYTVIVEEKATRTDFLADAKKPHRNGAVIGMGVFRYILAPAGLIQIEELPNHAFLQISEQIACWESARRNNR